MLLKLFVKNYILIHDLEIDFSDGFSAVTGETGAGKSIILGALSLILGQRADSGILLDKSGKCIVEGHFGVKGYHLEDFFENNELDFENTLTLRREINQNGKSRAFINDTPVYLTLLKELGDRLVNVHSQNSVVTLNDSNFQLAVIDSYAGIEAEVAHYKEKYLALVTLKKQLEEWLEREAKLSGEKDYYHFLLDELTQACLAPGELQEISLQLGVLTHAGEIKSGLYRARLLLSETDQNILDRLAEVLHLIGNVARFKPDLASLAERINTNYIDIKDISKELSSLEEEIVVDPATMETLTQRHDLLNHLMKKHQVTSVEELISLREVLENRVADEEGLQDRIMAMHKEIETFETGLYENGARLSTRRRKVIPVFEKEVTGILAKLGISMARFEIDFHSVESLCEDGIDKVKFLFSANRGVALKEVSNAASGGELSRLMLAIKSMISQKNLLPTIIFDEIDNGVSGDIAGRVGAILKQMGRQMQVIAITHLPQIAAKGDRHYWVYKAEDSQVTSTYIRQLTPEERIVEIAKMLSSEVVTESAYTTANELLNN